MASRYSTPVRSLVAQDAAQFVRREWRALILPADAQDQSAVTRDHTTPEMPRSLEPHPIAEPTLVRHLTGLLVRPETLSGARVLGQL